MRLTVMMAATFAAGGFVIHVDDVFGFLLAFLTALAFIVLLLGLARALGLTHD